MQPAPPSPMPVHLWVKPARCLHVVDGDTLDVHVDMGMHALRLERLRLLNVNTPERKKPTMLEGDAAKQYTIEWLSAGHTGPMWASIADDDEWPLLIETYKSDAFGRYLALVWRVSDGACLNDDLITDGMARVDIRT